MSQPDESSMPQDQISAIVAVIPCGFPTGGPVIFGSDTSMIAWGGRYVANNGGITLKLDDASLPGSEDDLRRAIIHRLVRNLPHDPWTGAIGT